MAELLTATALPVACEFEGRRIYAPVDWRKGAGGGGYPEGLAPMKRHRRCVECGGWLQGSRMVVGVCFGCS